eukprot:TRINITY_DN614_c0_g1_i1.p1 TRINITY_DN614_c0_g1~~TRINITY_DN614_c0_g1_i1.p1  ORF type:complete len:384 (+),score=94.52 TRINITY_DN614_c0_g1_i1:118-1269(+)
MSAFTPAKEPKSKLGYYRLLSPTASVRVSPLCLGAMNFGTSWSGFMGSMDKKTTYEILDYFVEQGGNFIDTANNYQNEESEKWLGEWMVERKNRDQMVIATKFSSPYTTYKNPDGINVNNVGNSRKNLVISVKESLKKLQTDYIDLLYVHWWDHTMKIEEMMHSLHHLVVKGKVLYLGVSDTPAWVVAKANTYARCQGLTPFCVYQGLWSIAKRDLERDIIPMCINEGMSIAPWGALGRGNFKTEEELKKMGETGEQGRKNITGGPITQVEKDVTKIMARLAKEKGTSVTGIALSWVMQKTPHVFPIIGGRKVEQLKDNIEALEKVRLTPEEFKELEDASPIDLGFPMNWIAKDPNQNMLLNTGGKYAFVGEPQPVVHAPEKK